MKTRAGLLTLIVTAMMTASVTSQDKGGVDITGAYDVVANWLKPIEQGTTTYVLGVFAQSPDRILLVSTGATPGEHAGTFNPKAPGAKVDHLLTIVDRNGRVVEEWRQWLPLWSGPHYARINPYDPEKHIWFIDRESHQIFEFTNDGKSLVKTMGEKGVAAADEKHFGRPAEITWLPDGTFFVADGYQNRRVVKFDKTGQFLMAWGSEGTGPGQFSGPVHCVVVDAKRRVYVADPGNHRIQIFDDHGKFLDQWEIPNPSHMAVTQDQSVWVSDLRANRLLKYNTDGKLLTYWGTAGNFPGAFNGAHDFSVDSEGSLYIAMAFGGPRVEKFIPKPNADRSRLMGQLFK